MPIKFQNQFTGKFVRREKPVLAGVYGIFNIKNGRVYVGSSKSVSNRVGMHLSKLDGRTKKQANRELQADWNKFGANAFEFAVLEKLSSRASQKKLWEREQHWMDQFPFRYNLGPRADSSLGIKMPAHIREKISRVHLGIRPSAKTIAKMSFAQKKRMNTPEMKQWASEQSKKRHAAGKIDTKKLLEGLKKYWASPRGLARRSK